MCMSLKFNRINEQLENVICNDRLSNYCSPYMFSGAAVRRFDVERDKPSLLRPDFIRDIEKILHLPVYNRYSDKTQVFSFYLNDDISRRALHVQLVSRIARNIGNILGLNLDLIEAIALGHDIGHTPFGHSGEHYLSDLLYNESGYYFNHNVHSVRVLDKIYKRNLSLQTLDGILCHNGEMEERNYTPCTNLDFNSFDQKMNDCYINGKTSIDSLVPSTLEGCVVKICDIIAYLGKDRQDAKIAHIIDNNTNFTDGYIGLDNADIINNITVDIIENSYGKNAIRLSEEAFSSLKIAKDENYKFIYKNKLMSDLYDQSVRPMFKDLFYKLLDDLNSKDENSFIYRHHISHVFESTTHYSEFDYLSEKPEMIVTDYIASMTDDYFIELHKMLFPNSEFSINYKSYFEN